MGGVVNTSGTNSPPIDSPGLPETNTDTYDTSVARVYRFFENLASLDPRINCRIAPGTKVYPGNQMRNKWATTDKTECQECGCRKPSADEMREVRQKCGV
jgi:hypothetical protein